MKKIIFYFVVCLTLSAGVFAIAAVFDMFYHFISDRLYPTDTRPTFTVKLPTKVEMQNPTQDVWCKTHSDECKG